MDFALSAAARGLKAHQAKTVPASAKSVDAVAPPPAKSTVKVPRKSSGNPEMATERITAGDDVVQSLAGIKLNDFIVSM